MADIESSIQNRGDEGLEYRDLITQESEKRLENFQTLLKMESDSQLTGLLNSQARLKCETRTLLVAENKETS